jgi:hypothetical protein
MPAAHKETTMSQATNDARLIEACERGLGAIRAYAAGCENEGGAGGPTERLVALQRERDSATFEAAEIPATTGTGECATATLLLALLDRLDRTPTNELARSLANAITARRP